MSVSRRSFFHTVGAGSAVLSADFLIGRGREAMAFEVEAFQPPDDGGFLRIDSNENARGPGRSALEAIRNGITARVGRGYPPDYVGDLTATIASTFGVERTGVIIATGSGPILEAATRGVAEPCSAPPNSPGEGPVLVVLVGVEDGAAPTVAEVSPPPADAEFAAAVVVRVSWFSRPCSWRW